MYFDSVFKTDFASNVNMCAEKSQNRRCNCRCIRQKLYNDVLFCRKYCKTCTKQKFETYCRITTNNVKIKGNFMNMTGSLLYLLLLYAVLDKNNKLSTTTGLVIAFVILLLNCYAGRCCRQGQTLAQGSSTDNTFNILNGF